MAQVDFEFTTKTVRIPTTVCTTTSAIGDTAKSQIIAQLEKTNRYSLYNPEKLLWPPNEEEFSTTFEILNIVLRTDILNQ